MCQYVDFCGEATLEFGGSTGQLPEEPLAHAEGVQSAVSSSRM
jgi:hypothetical protein